MSLCLALAACFSSVAFAESPEARDTSREILLLLPAGKVVLAEDIDRAAMSDDVLRSRRLQGLCSAYGVQSLERPMTRALRTGSAVPPVLQTKRRLTDWSNFYLIAVSDPTKRGECVDSLNASGEVVFAEANTPWIPCGAAIYPNDPQFTSGFQWGLWNTMYQIGADIHAPGAWSVTTGEATQKIAIIDPEGVNYYHEDLDGRFAAYANNTGGHGTAVAGVAAATANNAKGVAGVDWNARIYPYYAPTTVDVGSGMHVAYANGCRVINCSAVFLPGENPISIRLAFADAYEANSVCVAAMGNYGDNTPLAPARYQQGVIAVGATGPLDALWPLSNTGGHIDVVAPGQLVTVCGPGTTDYRRASETSYAAAHVSGIASLLRAYNSALDNDDIEYLIRLSADPINGQTGWNETYGTGRVNALRALNYLRYPNRLVHGSSSSPGGTVVGSQHVAAMQFYGVPGLTEGGTYEAVRLDVQRTFTFDSEYPSGVTPVVWGRGRNALGYSSEAPNVGLGWCDVVWGQTTQTHFTMRTYVYEIFVLGVFKGYWPCAPSQVSYEYSILELHNPADPANSYFVPEEGAIATPGVGSAAIAKFKTCPNNDLPIIGNHAPRIKVVLKDATGAPVVGVQAGDIYAQFNGGTIAQGFYGGGADSIIANATWNAPEGCPTVMSISADDSTSVDGVTYISFYGHQAGDPAGIASRDPTRKWGHYDFEIPVFVRGERLLGRLVEGDANGSYLLRIKNVDWYGGLGQEAGETVSSMDYNGLGIRDALDYWKDFDSSGSVSSTDFNLMNLHIGHDCNTPDEP